jgi:anti-sigma regulatory factor (Ser/Thr protein kinase)
VRIENTRTVRPVRFGHRAATYADADRLLAITVPLLRAGLDEGRPTVLIASAAAERAVRAELDERPALVSFPQPDDEVRGSGQSAVARLAERLRELTDRHGPAVAVVQHVPGASGVASWAWGEAEAAANLALADLPVTMTCLFPTALGDAARTAVRWNHPQLLDADGRPRHNPAARPPGEVLATVPVAPPLPLGRPDHELSFTPWQLTEVRGAVVEAAEAMDMDPDRAQDFVLAVNEVAGNAVEHGRGTGVLRMWSTERALICEVHDTGRLPAPLLGLRAPHPASPRGRGVWIARQLCDLLHVWSDLRGTHVRLQTAPR